MNRFCKSTFSLLLATLLLFSAAGISFGMVLQSTHAYAVGPSVETSAPTPGGEGQREVPEQGEAEKAPEKKETIPESEENTQENDEEQEEMQNSTSSINDREDSNKNTNEDVISNLTGSVKGVRLGEIDLIQNIAHGGEEGILELDLEITAKELEKLQNYKPENISFFDHNFMDVNHPNQPVDIESSSFVPENGSIVFTITTKQPITYSALSDKIRFNLILSNEHEKKLLIPFSRTIRTQAASENYEIKSAIFVRNSDDSIISRITRGRYDKLIVTIYDYALTLDKFNEIRNHIYININSDVFDVDLNNISLGEDETELNGGGVAYDLIFENIYYSGKDNNLQLIIDYGDMNFTKRRLVHTLSQCEIYEPEPDDNDNYPDDDDDHDSSSSKPDIPPPTPNIIVSTYDYGGGNVTAAGNFTLTMTLMNTSKRVNVDNVVMKLSVPEAFTLTSSSNTFYIERIAKRSSVERTVNLSVKPNADAISHPIKVSFTYESVINDERKQFSAEQDISIPVSQLDRFSLNPVEMPSEIYVGEDSSIEATFVNKGKSTVYNVTAEITGNLSQPGQRQFIGNVESGKEESADFLIGALEAGTISGEVVISYEDANMNVNELRSPFTTTAVSFEMPAPNPGLDVMNPDDIGEAPPEPWYQKIPAWGWTTGGVTAIILLSFAAKAMRRHRELKLLEDSDEDF